MIFPFRRYEVVETYTPNGNPRILRPTVKRFRTRSNAETYYADVVEAWREQLHAGDNSVHVALWGDADVPLKSTERKVATYRRNV